MVAALCVSLTATTCGVCGTRSMPACPSGWAILHAKRCTYIKVSIRRSGVRGAHDAWPVRGPKPCWLGFSFFSPYAGSAKEDYNFLRSDVVVSNFSCKSSKFSCIFCVANQAFYLWLDMRFWHI